MAPTTTGSPTSVSVQTTTGSTTTAASTTCSSTTCLNNGVCLQLTATSYVCNCASGFSGTNCEINLATLCSTNNGGCASGSTCYVELTTFALRCVCPPLVTGARCDQALNPCFDASGLSTCKNGGTCTSISSYPYYSCSCVSGFYGTQCELSGAASICTDQNPSLCYSYAQRGNCNCYNWFGYVRDYCRYSCNNCGFTTCVDRYSECSYLANNCALLALTQPHPCPRSCNAC